MLHIVRGSISRVVFKSKDCFAVASVRLDTESLKNPAIAEIADKHGNVVVSGGHVYLCVALSSLHLLWLGHGGLALCGRGELMELHGA